jgi:hypothetical protein
MKRKIFVPGVPLEVSEVAGDITKTAVIAIPHGERVVMVLYNRNGAPTAWSMTQVEADRFAAAVREAHQAIEDDAKIAELEKDFGD